MAGGRDLELDRPRSASELIGATFQVYRGFPLLFLTLAGAVIVPYELIVLLATGRGPLARGHVGALADLVLTVADLALITPLISALHVHAVRELRDGDRPQLVAVAKQSLAVLPGVSAAVIMSFLGTVVGFLALIVPGIVLWLRWSVVAQAAAIEGKGWLDALHRSTELSRENYGHVFGLLFLVGLISFAPNFALGRAFGHTDTTVASFVADTALLVVLWSFSALATALLFFDLTARFEGERAGGQVNPEPSSGVKPDGHPLDPASYTDEGRPPGWYVDPDRPWRMRYWAADGKPGWSRRTTKTPKKTLAEWRDLRWVREQPPT